MADVEASSHWRALYRPLSQRTRPTQPFPNPRADFAPCAGGSTSTRLRSHAAAGMDRIAMPSPAEIRAVLRAARRVADSVQDVPGGRWSCPSHWPRA